MIVKELHKVWKVFYTNKDGADKTMTMSGKSLDEVKKKFVDMADELGYAGSDAKFFVDRMTVDKYWIGE